MALSKYLLHFFLLLIISCNSPPEDRIGIKIKPLYLREMQSWINQNSKSISYEKPPERFPAKFLLDGVWHKGKVRIRGDLNRHWIGAQKSYRITLDDSLFKRMKEFDLIRPEDKDYESEGFGYHMASKLGLIVPDIAFRNVVINNQNAGIYFVLERFTSESFERRNLPEGNIIKEANAWLDFLHLQNKSLYRNVFYSKKDFNKLALKPHIYETAFTNEFSNQAMTLFGMMLGDMEVSLSKESSPIDWSKYINMDAAASWSAIVILFGAHHASLGDNLRWYFHPYKNNFSPILYDLLPTDIPPDQCLFERVATINPWARLWDRDLKFQDLVTQKLKTLAELDLKKEWKNFLYQQQVPKKIDTESLSNERFDLIQRNHLIIKSISQNGKCIFKSK